MTQTPSETTARQPIVPVAVSVPQRELGYANSGGVGTISGWWDSLSDERTPELQWPQAYDVYDDMLNSPQIYSVLRSVIMPILAAGARLDCTGVKSEIAELVRDDMGLPIVGEGDATASPDDDFQDERFSYPEHLELALEEALGYGHSYHEQKAYGGPDSPDGLWHLQKLAWRPPRSIAKFNLARDGGLISIEQKPYSIAGGVVSAASTKNIPLPVGRLVAYVHRRKGANWLGRSLLRPAYEPFLINNRAKRLEMVYVERHASPTPVFTDNADGNAQTLAAGRNIARGIRTGSTAGAGLANGQKLELLAPQGTPPDTGKIKTYNDDLIGRVVLAHFLNLGASGAQGHSYALGSTFEDFFTLGVQAFAKWVARIGSRHIVRDLVWWNWPGERYPRIVFDEIGSKQEAIVLAIAQLVTAGVLRPDEDLEKFVRVALGLPPGNNSRALPAPKETP